MSGKEKMRLFIASPVLMPEFEIVKRDFSSTIYGNWSKELNLHLTWSFLGELESTKEVIMKLRKIKPLELELPIRGLGYFGEPPKIFWAGIDSKIAEKKAKEFEGAGFDMRSFKPHITLNRIKSLSSSIEFQEKLKKYKNIELGRVKRDIVLYKSELTKYGPIYSKVWEIVD